MNIHKSSKIIINPYKSQHIPAILLFTRGSLGFGPSQLRISSAFLSWKCARPRLLGLICKMQLTAFRPMWCPWAALRTGNDSSPNHKLQIEHVGNLENMVKTCSVQSCFLYKQMTVCSHSGFLRQWLSLDWIHGSRIGVWHFWWPLQRTSSSIFCFRRNSRAKTGLGELS